MSEKMRIVIDLQSCQSESRFRGIGRYSMSLVKAMIGLAREHEIWLVLNNQFPVTVREIQAEFSDLIEKNRIVAFSIPGPTAEMNPYNAWRTRSGELLREHFLAELNPDVVYVSSLFEGWVDDAVTSIEKIGSEFITAATLYDLIPLMKQDIYLSNNRIKQYYFRKIESLRSANLLLAISEHSRQQGILHLDLQPEKVVNISAAIDSSFYPCPLPDTERKAILDRYQIRKPFILCSPGGFDSRKNIYRLIEAYATLPREIRENNQLMITSRIPEGDRQNLIQHCQRYRLTSDEVLLAGYVSDRDLVVLYNLCKLFVFPSLYEGFGLPVLEAMACGAAVIGSNATSIPEVVGRKDALFNPESTESISQSICKALTNETYRKSLCEHSILQARKFSWDKSAEKALAALENLALSKKITKSRFFCDAISSNYNSLIDSVAQISVDRLPSENDLVATAQCIAENEISADRVNRACELKKSIQWRIEGPFDSTYSLALLNRETARGLNYLGHKVALFSTEGPGDFLPNLDYLRANPDLKEMHEFAMTTSASEAEVVSRNLYPPRVHDVAGRINLIHHFAWEESGFPHEWILDFNTHLQGITCLSKHVEKVLVDHGIVVPISTSGCGVDHWERIEFDRNFEVQARKFRFLHVSSCFPRKGVDILLKAFGQAFSNVDDVSLIIKTFPNPHNTIRQQIAECKEKNSNYPDILLIEKDLKSEELKSLYMQSHVLVAPSRAEGFGLPLAEAMLSGLPVITTNWGGQTDFCNEETAWLIDFSFERAKTHFELPNSVWAEPSKNDLANVMRSVWSMPKTLRDEKAIKGREILLKHFQWTQVAERLVESARSWAKVPAPAKPRIGWVSTYNTRCGIAAYSKHLIEHISEITQIFAAYTDNLVEHDEAEVIRCWQPGETESLTNLHSQINKYNIDVLVIQFNYGFFNFEYFADFLKAQLKANRIIVVIMHATCDPDHAPHKKLSLLAKYLAKCHRILVHTPADMNRLKSLGIVSNVTLFPHGVVNYLSMKSQNPGSQSKVSKRGSRLIASYGFFLPQKGLLELIKAFSILCRQNVNIKLRMLNAEYAIPESSSLINQAKELIKRLGLSNLIDMRTSFLSEEESFDLLSEADLIVFPYQYTAESSSAAVRYGLATGKSVAVTPLSIFDDVSPAVWNLPGYSPDMIAEGIRQILQEIDTNSSDLHTKLAKAERWREAHDYSYLSQRLYRMLQALSFQRDNMSTL